MTTTSGPYSGNSTIALVARVSAVAFGVLYGNVKLNYVKAAAKSRKISESAGLMLKLHSSAETSRRQFSHFPSHFPFKISAVPEVQHFPIPYQ